MKIKSRPEDFVVEELADLPPAGGPVSIYRLEKSGLTTTDAVAHVAREFGLRRDRVRFGGLKDRHALTRQYLWIEAGPERSVAGRDTSLTFLGRHKGPPVLHGNRFAITLRDLDPAEAEKLPDAARAVAADGVPNYFDSQRFGSARHGHGFFGKRIVLRQWEEALKLFMAKSSEFDTETKRKRLAGFQRHWGQWEHCLEHAATRTEDHVFGYLMRRRGDFKGAIKLIERPMLALLMHAYQSWLWNQAVGKLLTYELPGDVLMRARYLGGTLLMYRFIPADLLDRWRRLAVPLLAYRTKFTDASVERAYTEVLHSERLEQAQFKPAGHNLPYMKAEDRALLLVPRGVEVQGPSADEENAGRKKATAKFDLARGGYATLVVKRLRLLISEKDDGELPADDD